MGANTSLTLLVLYIINLNYQITLMMVLICYISSSVFITYHKFYSALAGDYNFTIGMSITVGFALCYLDTKA